MAKGYSEETRMLARALFIKRVKVADISRETGVPKRTIYDWIVKDDWDALVKTDDITETYDRRILTILGKSESLTSADLNELEHLQKLKSQHLKLSGRIAAVTLPGDPDPVASTAQQLQGDLLRDNSDQPKNRQAKKKKGQVLKNDFRGITKDELLEHAQKTLFKYQYQELQQLLNDPDNETYRNRFFLKSRQIGMTYYFAMEAFILAILEGRNKSFISASKNQSLFFRDYIAGFAFDWFGIDLKGTEKVELVTDHGKVKFTFFSTNSSTSQGVASDVYMDEVFWIRDFEKLERLAGACATQHIYRKTYLSTPSTKSHAAYVLWNGDKYRKLTEHDPVEFPPLVMPTAAQLAKGHLGTDGLYRKRITIHNAMDGGFNLVKLYQIRRENLPEAFRQLYECEFIDDQNAAFVLEQLLACAVTDARWPGYSTAANDPRPYAERPVVIGYDPSRSRDSAEVVALAVPLKPGGKFTLLERVTMLNENWAVQARTVNNLIDRYNTVYVAIDVTGPGSGVFEKVQEHYPRAVALHYSVDLKNRLVMKAQTIIKDKRLQFDAQHQDIPLAFMAIRRQSTGNAITYVAARDKNIGHADVAWALMHALHYEPLTSSDGERRKTTAAISEAA